VGSGDNVELGTWNLNSSSMYSASPIYALRRSSALICEAPSRRIMLPRSDNDFLGHHGISRFLSVSRRIEREKHATKYAVAMRIKWILFLKGITTSVLNL